MTKVLCRKEFSERASVALEFKWQDLWLGVFPRRTRLHETPKDYQWDWFRYELWVCFPLPCLPLHLTIDRPHKTLPFSWRIWWNGRIYWWRFGYCNWGVRWRWQREQEGRSLPIAVLRFIAGK